METWDAIRARRNVRAYGYQAGRPLVPLTKINRRRFEEVVHRGRW